LPHLLLPHLLALLLPCLPLMLWLLWQRMALLWQRLALLSPRLLVLIALVLLLPVQLFLRLLQWRLVQILPWQFLLYGPVFAERLVAGATKCDAPVCATCSAANPSPI
jgi:hypothetical protein